MPRLVELMSMRGKLEFPNGNATPGGGSRHSPCKNQLPTWKRNDLAMMLISLWSLDISLDQALGTLLGATQVAKRYRNEGDRERERGPEPVPARKALRMKTSVYIVASSCICSRPFLSFFPSFLSPSLCAVIGVLSAAAALSPYLFPHLPPHSFACAIGVLLDRRFVCRCCLVFSPTKRTIATTSIHSNPNGNASKIANRRQSPRLQHLIVPCNKAVVKRSKALA